MVQTVPPLVGGDVHIATNQAASAIAGAAAKRGAKLNVLPVLAVSVLLWIYEVRAPRLATRDQPAPSKPFIPGSCLTRPTLDERYYRIRWGVCQRRGTGSG